MITRDRFTAIVLTLVVWGLAGGVFGALFAGIHEALAGMGLEGWQPPVAAAAASAMFTAALYSAMPVALTGAMAGVLASIASLIVLGPQVTLPAIAGSAALAGLAAGSFYAWMSNSGGRPLMETLTGLASGLIAGAALVLVTALSAEPAGMFVLAAGVVAVVGALFQVSERWMVGLGAGWLPGSLSGAVVAALVATLVAGSMWILGHDGGLFGDMESGHVLSRVEQQLLPGFLGGLTGGAITGLLLEVLGFHLEDHPGSGMP
jgi:TM2 domain-containing membrane protein YozV